MTILDLLVSVLEMMVPFIAMFALLVGVHEYGHYRVAKALGISATAFSIGFGKVLWSMKDQDGCEWQLRAIPLGGFVRFLGDRDATSARSANEGVDLNEAERRKRLMFRSPFDRALVLAAGPAANFVFGLFVLAALYSGFGRPVIPPIVQSLVPGAPAEKAGIIPNDRILRVNGMRVDTFGDITSEIGLHPGELIEVVIKRDGSDSDLSIALTPQPTKIETFGTTQTMGRIGIVAGSAEIQATGPLDAIVFGLRDVIRQTRASLITLGQLFSGSRSIDDVGSPIKMASIAKNAAAEGLASWVFMLAVFSINLAVMNLLPLPVLDGGQLVVCAIEGAIRRPLNDKVLIYVQMAGACLLLSLMTVLAVNDIWGIIQGTSLTH